MYGITVTLYDAGTGAVLGTAGTTAVVDDRPVTPAATGPTAIERAPGATGAGDFLIAALVSADPGDAGAGYEAWVAWGDGTESVGTVYGSGGQFWVGGDHAYALSGAYTAVVRVWAAGSPWRVWEARTGVTVTDQVQGAGARGGVTGVARVEAGDGFDDVRGWMGWNGAGDLKALTTLTRIAEGASGSGGASSGGPGWEELPGAGPPVGAYAGSGTYTGSGSGSGTPQIVVSYYTVGAPATDPEPGAAPGYTAPATYRPDTEVVKGNNADGADWPVRAADAPLSGGPGFPDDVSAPDTLVALFYDPVPAPAGAAGYQVTIDYGDGTRTPGAVWAVPGAAMAFEVRTLVPHAYAAPGDYRVSVLVTSTEPAGGTGRGATHLSAFTVSDAGTDDDNGTKFRAYQRRDERDDATWAGAGPGGAVSVNTGAVRLAHELDLDQSPGTGVGRNPHLVYNSATVNPIPVIEAVVPTAGLAGKQLKVTLTWPGASPSSPQVTITRFNVAAGTWQVIAVSPQGPIATGVYKWALKIEVEDAPGQLTAGLTALTATGPAQVVNNTQSPFGAGWALDLQWRLEVVNKPDQGLRGAQLIYGTGESRYFAQVGGRFVAPDGEFGVLEQTPGGYRYTSEFGEVWAFGSTGTLLSITDRLGLVTQFGYSGARLSSVTAPDGYVTPIGATTGLVTLTESGNRTVALTVSAAAVPLLGAITLTAGILTQIRAFAYSNSLVADETWGTQVTHYRYGTTGRAYEFELGTGFGSVYAVQSATEWGFHSGQAWVHFVPGPFAGGVADPRGYITLYGVDALGHAGTSAYPDGTSTTAKRDRHGQVEVFTDERGFATRYRHDARGRVERVSHPDGGHEGYGYDPVSGDLLWTADGYDRKTVYGRDRATGNLMSVTDRLGNVTRYTYYSGAQRGLVQTVSDPRDGSVRASFTYDGFRRLQTSKDALQNLTTYAYEPAGFGNVTLVTDPLTRTTKTQYDGLNRVRASTDVFGATTAWTYDAQGRVLTATDARNVTTVSAYDARGLTKTVTGAAGTALARTTWFGYDAAGNRTVEWDPREYDTPDFLSGVIGTGESFWTKTVTQYDSRNRVIAVTEGAAYTAFDAPTPLSGDNGALARTTRTGYDKAGNVARVEYTPQYGAAPGYVIRDYFTYDAVGRVKTVTRGTEWVALAGLWVPAGLGRVTATGYDLNGNASWTRASDGVVTLIKYDTLDRAELVWEAPGLWGGRLTGTGYDKAGNVAWTTDGNGTKTVYGYDALDRVRTVTEAAGTLLARTTYYEYDAVGRVVRAWAPRLYDAQAPLNPWNPGTNRIGTSYAYNDLARTETVTEAFSVPTALSLPALNHNAPATVTQYDELGRVELVTDPLVRATAYVYDELGRRSAVLENWVEAFPGAPATDQYYERAVLSAYDAADNLGLQETAGIGGGDGGTGWQSVTDRYTYDVLNRRTGTARAVDGTGFSVGPNGPVVTATGYDALDRVVWERDPKQSVTDYTYSAFGEVLRVREGGTAALTNFLRATDYTYDDAGRVQTVTRDRFLPGQAVTGPARVTTEYGYDRLGRTMSVTEAAGVPGYQRTTWYTYDGADRLLTATEPLVVLTKANQLVYRVTRNYYDPLGRLIAVTEADGAYGWARTTQTGYDAADNPVWALAPVAYDQTGGAARPTNPLAVPPERAAVTVHLYDALNRRTSTTGAANAPGLGHAPPVTLWVYDAVGRVVREVSPEDQSDRGTRRAVAFVYDTLDRVTTTAEGRVPTTTGLLTVIRWTKTGYDAAGHVVQQVSGYLVSSPGATDAGAQNQRLQETRFTYDALGRLRKQDEVLRSADPSKGVTEIARVTWSDYDASGNRVLVAVAANSVSGISAPTTQSEADFLATRRTVYSYDRLDRVETVTEAWAPNAAIPGGANGRTYQTAVSANLGHGSPVTSYVYDAQDHVTKVTDPRGVTTETWYDVLGRKAFEVRGSNQGSAASAGFVALQRAFFYDPADRLTWVRTDNLWVVNQQGAPGVPVRETTFGSVWTGFGYDPLDRQTRQIEGAGTGSARQTITTYDAADHPLSVTTGYAPVGAVSAVDGTPLGYSAPVTTRYWYDALGRVRAPERGWTLFADELAVLEYLPVIPWGTPNTPAFVGVYGHTRPRTTLEYDASGRTTFVRTNVSNSGADTDSVTRYEYDRLGRVAYTTEGETGAGGKAEARRTAVTYDSLDAVVGTLQLGSPVVTYEYDRIGRVTKQTTVGPDPLYTTYAYNVFGEVTEQADQTGAGATVTSRYDLLGRVQSQSKKGTWEDLAYQYDPAGNLTTITDTVYPLWYGTDGKVNDPSRGVARATTTYSAYDALGRVISRTDTYWSAGSPTGHTTQYRYDALGRVEAVWAPDGKVRWFGYDAVGRRVQEYWWRTTALPSKGDATLNPVGTGDLAGATVIVTAFDAGDRVTYSFQATTTLRPVAQSGRFVFVKPTGTGWAVAPYTATRLGYDGLGRLRTETTSGVTLTHGYDAAGRGVQVTDSQGGSQATSYDLAGRVTARAMTNGAGAGAYFTFEYRDGTDWGEKAPTFRDDRVERITGRDGPNGTAVVGGEITYDALGREVRRAWASVASGGDYSEALDTTYQPNGLVSTEARRGFSTLASAQWAPSTVRYVYDGFNQVLRQDTLGASGAVSKTGTVTPRDAAGNGPYASSLEAMKTGNRVTTGPSRRGTYALSYDGQGSGGTGTAGNVTGETFLVPGPVPGTQQVAEAWVLGYDGRNRLVSATHRAGPVGSAIERVNYVYDTFDRLVARSLTTNPSDATIGAGATRYLYADGQPYADATTGGTIHERYLFGPSGEPLARVMFGSGGPDFYVTDRQDSVLQIVGDDGSTLKRVLYRGLEAVTREGPARTDRFELGGQTYDANSELSMLGDRWFDPAIGRYLTEGGRGIGLNPYPVADNNWPNEGGNGTAGDGGTADDWGDRKLPSGHDTLGEFGAWLHRRGVKLFTDPEHQRKVFSGVNDMGPHAFVEGLLARDAQTGRIEWFRGGFQTLADDRYTTRLLRGLREDRDGYARAGWSRGGANWMAFQNNMPFLNWGLRVEEFRSGMSMRGANFGAPLDDADYTLGALQMVNDLTFVKGLIKGRGAGGPPTPARTWAGAAGRATGWAAETALHALANPLGAAFNAIGRVTGLTVRGFYGTGNGGGQTNALSRAAHPLSTPTTRAGLLRAWAAERVADWTGTRVCFVAGTPIQWEHGAKGVEQFKGYADHGDGCDRVVSRSEHDPDGVLTLRRVLRTFVRTGLVFHLRLPGGIIIGTTAEHPFFVRDRGWTPAQELKPGDELALMMNGGVRVEGIEDTGRVETVYNLEIEDDHTYFVGCDQWGFSVWAHNADGCWLYRGLEGDDLAAVMRKHYPEPKKAVNRQNLDPDFPNEMVKTKAPGKNTEAILDQVSSPQDRRSYVTYAFVNKQTGAVEYVGRGISKPEGQGNTILHAVRQRLSKHKSDKTFDSNTQAVIILDTQKTSAAYRGAEQFFVDVYKSRGTLLENSYRPLDARDLGPRTKNAERLNEFFRSKSYNEPQVISDKDL